MNVTEVTDEASWDQLVGSHAWGHPLQLWGWGEAKRANGWTPHRLALKDGDDWVAAAQVLVWTIPGLGRKLAYVPRGPVAEPGSEAARHMMQALVTWAKSHRLLYVRVEPAWTKAERPIGWRASAQHIQMAETYHIDLTRPNADLLQAIDGKYRYYIRKADRDGVTVRRLPVGELGEVFAIYEETARRAGFGLHVEEYYRALSQNLGSRSYLLVAEQAGQQVAFLWLAAAGHTAYELYGGVNQAGRDARVNYALKWQAITMMQAEGYQVYDFNGRVSDGVSTFKQNFAPESVDLVGTWDYPIDALGYRLWHYAWPLAKLVGRHFAKRSKRS